jgi:hypothetical protein
MQSSKRQRTSLEWWLASPALHPRGHLAPWRREQVECQLLVPILSRLRPMQRARAACVSREWRERVMAAAALGEWEYVPAGFAVFYVAWQQYLAELLPGSPRRRVEVAERFWLRQCVGGREGVELLRHYRAAAAVVWARRELRGSCRALGGQGVLGGLALHWACTPPLHGVRESTPALDWSGETCADRLALEGECHTAERELATCSRRCHCYPRADMRKDAWKSVRWMREEARHRGTARGEQAMQAMRDMSRWRDGEVARALRELAVSLSPAR